MNDQDLAPQAMRSVEQLTEDAHGNLAREVARLQAQLDAIRGEAMNAGDHCGLCQHAPCECPPPSYDDDIPIEIRRELMRCAVQNGRIDYLYLCHLFRRGRRAAGGHHPCGSFGYCAVCYHPLDTCSHCDIRRSTV
jgi:hypothetical protein